MDIINFAEQILELAADRDYWQRKALHYKKMHEEHMHDLNDRVQEQTEHMGNILMAALDPDSGINRMVRAVERDPLKGAKQ